MNIRNYTIPATVLALFGIGPATDATRDAYNTFFHSDQKGIERLVQAPKTGLDIVISNTAIAQEIQPSYKGSTTSYKDSSGNDVVIPNLDGIIFYVGKGSNYPRNAVFKATQINKKLSIIITNEVTLSGTWPLPNTEIITGTIQYNPKKNRYELNGEYSAPVIMPGVVQRIVRSWHPFYEPAPIQVDSFGDIIIPISVRIPQAWVDLKLKGMPKGLSSGLDGTINGEEIKTGLLQKGAVVYDLRGQWEVQTTNLGYGVIEIKQNGKSIEGFKVSGSGTVPIGGKVIDGKLIGDTLECHVLSPRGSFTEKSKITNEGNTFECPDPTTQTGKLIPFSRIKK